MSQSDDDKPEDTPSGACAGTAALSGALLDSRQRWRDFVSLAADLAFEVDAEGRFTFVAPDPALGWHASRLLGRFAAELLDSAGLDDPFLATRPVRQLHLFLRRGDASVASCVLSAVPLLDPSGGPGGARGIIRDVTASEASGEGVAAALRRTSVIQDILARMRHEPVAARMMKAALEMLLPALGADGVAVVEVGPRGVRLSHHVGAAPTPVLAEGAGLLRLEGRQPATHIGADGAAMITIACPVREAEAAALVAWRAAGGRDWDQEDRLLLASAEALVRLLLTQEATQREILRQARTDPLTGLMNRRAFLGEMERRFDRLDRDGRAATLLYLDIDAFGSVNETCGHEVGDEVLRSVAALLEQTFRPTDLIARLDGDKFGAWLDGADVMTAAERADTLTRAAPELLGELGGDRRLRITLSIGLAQRLPRGPETIDQMLRRANQAMQAAKRSGPGEWRAAADAP